jgi:hypothetical protein
LPQQDGFGHERWQIPSGKLQVRHEHWQIPSGKLHVLQALSLLQVLLTKTMYGIALGLSRLVFVVP